MEQNSDTISISSTGRNERIDEAAIRAIVEEKGLEVPGSTWDLLRKYVVLLLRTNQNVNLISRADEENVWEKHILHSISPLFHLKFEGDARLLDLGSGGGLPGIPLKIISPTLNVTLVDSIKKKIQAVDEILNSLNLSGINAVCGRAEELHRQPRFAGTSDIVISRAVAPLYDLVKWSMKLLCSPEKKMDDDQLNSGRLWVHSGTLIAMKGGALEDEIEKTKKRFKNVTIKIVPISFGPSVITQLVEKKLILVRPE